MLFTFGFIRSDLNQRFDLSHREYFWWKRQLRVGDFFVSRGGLNSGDRLAASIIPKDNFVEYMSVREYKFCLNKI
jgi:hypothetical protein